jgi:hypothetical protein
MCGMKTMGVIFLLLVGMYFPVEAADIVSLYQDNLHQFTGLAMAKSGRMIANYPRWQEPHQFDGVEIFSNGAVRPYPDNE